MTIVFDCSHNQGLMDLVFLAVDTRGKQLFGDRGGRVLNLNN